MNIQIIDAQATQDILCCFPVFSALRPQLNEQAFVEQVLRQYQFGYRIGMLTEKDAAVSVIGIRFTEFLAWGKILYIDDLCTLEKHQGKGYASTLLDWAVDEARKHHCNAIHLDSGYARKSAHKLYLKKGFSLSSHHFSMTL